MAQATYVPPVPAAEIVETPLPAPVAMRAQRLQPRARVQLADVPRPLIIVDGIVVSSGLSNDVLERSAADIESIEVIKGALAEQLYGRRAANGVISITTKNGRGR